MLDLGCGGGKICFIASQVVGTAGRGVPAAVCAKNFDIYAREPYAGHFHLLEPAEAVDRPPHRCSTVTIDSWRHRRR